MTTAAKAWFFAAARIIVGPPMSMFSMISAASASRRAAGALERIEVHADEVDPLDVVLVGRGPDVLRVVADGEQPGVQARVQRLDAPVHDLREAREVLDRADLQARALRASRAVPAGRDELDAELGQAPGEVDEPVLSETDSSARRMRTAPGSVSGSAAFSVMAGA